MRRVEPRAAGRPAARGAAGGAVGAFVVLCFVGVALAAPWLAPHDPVAIATQRAFESPSAEFWLGTDQLGRCLFSRLVFGARWSVGLVVPLALAVATLGLVVGVAAGAFGGWVDAVLMRCVDVVLAFPGLILVLAVVGMLGGGLAAVLAALAGAWAARNARVVRGIVLSVRDQPYVEAARALGVGRLRIVTRHLLPAALPSVAVLATLEMGELLLALAGLSFLGLGAQPPTPEWGAMLNDARAHALTVPQLMLWPGLAISLLVIGFNLLGDDLRDRLDPVVAPAIKASA